MKAIDIWFIACMIFILAAIFEYACLLYLKKLFIRYLENKSITIQVACDFSIFVKTYTFRRKRLEKIEEKAKIRSHSSASISTLEVRISSKKFFKIIA